MNRLFITLIFIGMLIIYSCENFQSNRSGEPAVKNIIFFIGDGMGVAQVSAAMMKSDDKLNMEKCDASALCVTTSLTNKVTDSAAGGTALATGKKTRNGVIGQDTTGTDYQSILKLAEHYGLSTGLVATSAITHATPASFIANQPSRNMYEAIAADFLKTDVDVIIGGGYNHFAVRSDSLNYIDSLRNKGYQIALTVEEMMAAGKGKLAALMYPEHPPKYTEGRGDMLPEATLKALEILSMNEKGFFLMVEGSQIDWGGHANDAEYVVEELLDMDRAIGVALEFQETHPNTLIVVTADHETGGITLPATDGSYIDSGIEFSTSGHTSVMVPVFAFGPGAGDFTGIMDNTGFYPLFVKLYSFKEE